MTEMESHLIGKLREASEALDACCRTLDRAFNRAVADVNTRWRIRPTTSAAVK
jgi:hypothetical protein